MVGPPGSGKSTLAGELAAALGFPHIELDALWWDADWTQAGQAVFTERLDAQLGSTWVADGNYFSTGGRQVLWPKADTIVWLDLPRRVTFPRVVRRSTSRVVRRTELFNGNRETVRDTLAADSVVWFSWREHPKYRRRYEAALADPELGHLDWVRLRSPAQTRRWLADLGRPPIT